MEKILLRILEGGAEAAIALMVCVFCYKMWKMTIKSKCHKTCCEFELKMRGAESPRGGCRGNGCVIFCQEGF